jgi:hypothetical protein
MIEIENKCVTLSTYNQGANRICLVLIYFRTIFYELYFKFKLDTHKATS